MIDCLVAIVKKYFQRVQALLAGLILIFLCIILPSDDFLSKGISNFSYRLIFYLILEGIWIAVWSVARNYYPNGGEYYGLIGNLLPVTEDLNQEADDKSFVDKINIYERSHFSMVKDFLCNYSEKTNWEDEDIVSRTKILAENCYDIIWKV